MKSDMEKLKKEVIALKKEITCIKDDKYLLFLFGITLVSNLIVVLICKYT
jgi:hypothetical protein